MNQFQQCVLRLWISKAAYTIDCIFKEEGQEPYTVPILKGMILSDVGVFWRQSSHKSINQFRSIKNGSGYISTKQEFKSLIKNIFLNVVQILKLLLVAKYSQNRCFSSRDFDPVLFDIKLKKYTKVRLRNDSIFTWGDSKKNMQKPTHVMNEIEWALKSMSLSEQTKDFCRSHLIEVLPSFFCNVSKSKRFKFFKRTKFINFGGDIFKSEFFLFFMWFFFDGEIEGAQHGGGYGILVSESFNSEQACYENFYFVNLSKSSKIVDCVDDMVYLKGKPGIILAGGNNVEKVDAFKSLTDEQKQAITKNSIMLRDFLKNSHKPYYIREHPLSNVKSSSNTSVSTSVKSKPLIFPRDRDLLVFDLPGTTSELNCIKFGLKYYCVFDIEAFNLTEVGEKHYLDLRRAGRLFSLKEFELVVKSHG